MGTWRQKGQLFSANLIDTTTDEEAWFTRRWRVRLSGVVRTAGAAYNVYKIARLFGRDVSDQEANLDSPMDASELTAMLGERATADEIADFMNFADENGDGAMTRREMHA